MAGQLVELPGGAFRMGCADSPYPADGEGPVREVELGPFAVAATTVTNADFARFVEASGYRTDAERYGWSFVFAGLLPQDFPPTRAVAAAPWWRQVGGASWWRPEGRGSALTGRDDHPVVHVSWRDVAAYCRWAGVRLPSEAEWEYAARGGLEQQPYPWGNQLTPGGLHRMNIWQGSFPKTNTAEDGYLGTAPADGYPPNAFGLHNMTGNVWEWCADWFSAQPHQVAPRVNPAGPTVGTARVFARRLLPVPLLLLPAIPHVGADGQHAGLFLGQRRIPGGSLTRVPGQEGRLHCPDGDTGWSAGRGRAQRHAPGPPPHPRSVRRFMVRVERS